MAWIRLLVAGSPKQWPGFCSRPGDVTFVVIRETDEYIIIQAGWFYRGADKSLARPTSRCILFDGENTTFDASLVIYINSTNIPPIMIINGIYEHKNLLSM